MDVALQTRAEQLANEIADQAKTIEDLNGLMRQMMKAGLERMLNTEMDVHLGRKACGPLEKIKESASEPLPASGPTQSAESGRKSANRRNGRSRKTLRADLGEMTIATPTRPRRHVRAATGRQVSAACAGLRREDSGDVRQGHDDPRHSRAGSGVVRR